MEKLEETARYEKLAIPRERVNNNDKIDPFKVKRGALSYRITDSLKELAMPKKLNHQKEIINFTPARVSKIRSDNERVVKLGPLLRSTRNQLKLDTYAAMIVKNDKQCPKRIKKLARPRGHFSASDQSV